MLKWKKNIKRYCFAGFLLLFFALALQVDRAAAETDSGIAEMEMDFQAEAKSETAEEILPHGEDFDLEARSGLRTFFATLGGTIQENYTMIMDSFHEKYAEFVQFLFDEYIFALIPQVPQKEYKIDVVGENLLLLKSSIGSGDSLGSLLNGWISFSTILNLVEESKSVYSLTALKAGRPCSFLINLDDNSLQKFEYEFDDTHKVIIQKTEDGHKVAFEEIIYDYELKFIEGTVTSNFYNAVIDLGENAVFAIRLADVFTFDIDFAREIKEGDKFYALVEKKSRDGNFNGYGRIIAARFINDGTSYEGFLFYDSEEEGKLSYFDRNGKALQKAFLRTPVHFTRISSRFTSARKHPILGITRAHPAIDYAAPKGTPVMAVGDGTVTRAAYTGGYGHLIILKHRGGLETQYAHLSGYAKGVRSGAKVSQGQVIGYVGSTGLSTGPHLDFRIKKGGKFVNPDHIIIPSKAPLRADQMEEYGLTVQKLDLLLQGKEDVKEFNAENWLNGLR